MYASKKKKPPSRKWNDNTKIGGEYLQIIYVIRGTCPEYIKNFYNSTTKRQLNLSSHFSKENTKMANTYMKRCLASLATREMQIKSQ